MDNYSTFIGLGLLIALIASVGYMGFRFGARGVTTRLSDIRSDIPSLDRVEGSIDSSFTAQQTELFRSIFLPAFAIGLAIVPQGDPKDMVAQFRDLMDVLTDRKPNVPPAQQTIAPDTSGVG